MEIINESFFVDVVFVVINLFKDGQRYNNADIELLIKTILKPMKNFKTLHGLSPNLMKEIFYRFPNLAHRKDNLYVPTRNTIEYNRIEENNLFSQ